MAKSGEINYLNAIGDYYIRVDTDSVHRPQYNYDDFVIFFRFIHGLLLPMENIGQHSICVWGYDDLLRILVKIHS